MQEEENGFAQKAAQGRKIRTIDYAAFGKAVINALNREGMDTDRLARITFVSGNPADHTRAVERIARGSGNAQDAHKIGCIAETLNIEVPYASNLEKKPLASPFGRGRPKGSGRGRGASSENAE